MKRHRIILCLIMGFCLLGNLAAEPEGDFPGDPSDKPASPAGGSVIESGRIIAVVNGGIIIENELLLRIKYMGEDKKTAIRSLIEDKLILQAAQEEDIEVSEKALDRALKRKIDKIGSREKFDKLVLEPLKMSYKEYRTRLGEEIIKEKYILRKLGIISLDQPEKIEFIIDTFVAPKEIREYFKLHKRKLGQEMIKTQQIILCFEDEYTMVSQKSLGQAIQEELQKGSDFTGMVQLHSSIKADSDGFWDWVPKGAFPEEVEKIIYDLKPGEMSDLIETANDFRIVKVIDKTSPMNDLDDPNVQDYIRKILDNKKFIEGIIRIKQELVKTAEVWPAGLKKIMLTK